MAAARRIGTTKDAAEHRQTRGRAAAARPGTPAAASATAAVCFVSVASASATPLAGVRRRAANTNAAVISGSMNTSKFAASASCGKNADAARRYSSAAAAAAHRHRNRRRASDASNNAGRDLGEHGDHAHRGEIVGAGHREHRRVEVRHERRLAVDGVDVEATTVAEHLGLGREVRLVGVEDPFREARDPQHHRQRDDRQDQRQDRDPAPARATWRRISPDGTGRRHHHGRFRSGHRRERIHERLRPPVVPAVRHAPGVRTLVPDANGTAPTMVTRARRRLLVGVIAAGMLTTGALGVGTRRAAASGPDMSPPLPEVSPFSGSDDFCTAPDNPPARAAHRRGPRVHPHRRDHRGRVARRQRRQRPDRHRGGALRRTRQPVRRRAGPAPPGAHDRRHPRPRARTAPRSRAPGRSPRSWAPGRSPRRPAWPPAGAPWSSIRCRRRRTRCSPRPTDDCSPAPRAKASSKPACRICSTTATSPPPTSGWSPRPAPTPTPGSTPRSPPRSPPRDSIRARRSRIDPATPASVEAAATAITRARLHAVLSRRPIPALVRALSTRKDPPATFALAGPSTRDAGDWSAADRVTVDAGSGRDLARTHRPDRAGGTGPQRLRPALSRLARRRVAAQARRRPPPHHPRRSTTARSTRVSQCACWPGGSNRPGPTRARGHRARLPQPARHRSHRPPADIPTVQPSQLLNEPVRRAARVVVRDRLTIPCPASTPARTSRGSGRVLATRRWLRRRRAGHPGPPPPVTGQRYWTIRANSSGSSDAPPTSAPSISGLAMSSAALPGFTLPPYWMRIGSAVVGAVERPPASPRITPHGLVGVGRGWRCGRCRWPRSARRRRRTSAASAAFTPGERAVGSGSVTRAAVRARLALLERLPHAHDRRHAVLHARPSASCSPSRRSRRRAGGAPSARRSRTRTASLASIGGLTSPVNAPWSSQWQFCAPRRHLELVGLDHGLQRAQVGERRAHHHVARPRSRRRRAGTTASARPGSRPGGRGASSSCRR